MKRPARSLLTLCAILLMATGCARTRTTVPESASESGPPAEGGGYLAGGPTVHLEDARNPEYASPLEALAAARRERDAAVARTAELERERDAAKRRADRLEATGDALRRAAVDAEAALDRERAVQREMAAALADLRIRTVELEQELFRLKVDRLTSLEEELAAYERADSGAKPSGEDPSARPARTEAIGGAEAPERQPDDDAPRSEAP